MFLFPNGIAGRLWDKEKMHDCFKSSLLFRPSLQCWTCLSCVGVLMKKLVACEMGYEPELVRRNTFHAQMDMLMNMTRLITNRR